EAFGVLPLELLSRRRGRRDARRAVRRLVRRRQPRLLDRLSPCRLEVSGLGRGVPEAAALGDVETQDPVGKLRPALRAVIGLGLDLDPAYGSRDDGSRMSASPRLVLLAAGACAVFGVVLKIADRGASTKIGASAGTREVPVASRSHGDPVDVAAGARSAVEPERPGPDAEGRDDGGGEPSASRHTAPTPYELLDANGSHVLSPRARARQARPP